MTERLSQRQNGGAERADFDGPDAACHPRPMTDATISGSTTVAAKSYRLPGTEREGIAQLSLLETALWPLQGGMLPAQKFETSYAFTTVAGRKTANVTVRAPLGLQTIDEYVLWGLLGATLCRQNPEPVLLATPFWLLKHLGLATGGSQYAELRDSLLRLATTSYQNSGFFNPESREHEHVVFQFLSMFLPTVGGAGETVDNERCWRIEWNPAFFRSCRAMGSTLLFDLDLHRALSPSSRRLFLKLKDRFWRSRRVFLNVDDLTVNGLGFAASRPLAKRKYDLIACIRELLVHWVIELGRGQTGPKDLFMKRRKGSYVVVFHEGEYFRRRGTERRKREKNAISDDPLYEPLRQIGVDEPGIRRVLREHGRGMIQRWVRITDAAMHETPRGFPGFKVSPAAFLMNGIRNNRTPPDWWHRHEKRREQERWRTKLATPADDGRLRPLYEAERAAALRAYLASPEGRESYQRAYGPYQEFYKLTDPHGFRQAAHAAAESRVEKYDFRFPAFEEWAQTQGDARHVA